MKKSKIIVPALGILAFSTAAAVTGTVAWFTANRQVNINNTQITAFNPEAGLKVTLSAGKGGSVKTAEGKGGTAAVFENYLLRDASLNFKAASNAPAVWRSVLGVDGDVSGFADVTDAAKAGTKAGTNSASKDFYWCSLYTATFALENQDSTTTYTLSYDHSKTTATDASGDTAKDIDQALRIGIVSSTGFTIIAPFNEDGTLNYVSDASTATSAYSAAEITNGTEKFEIGDLKGTGTQAITVYTWFEGTDPKCVNGQVDNLPLSVSLGFTMVEKTA